MNILDALGRHRLNKLANPATEPTKACNLCKEVKPVEDFYKKHGCCKACSHEKKKRRDSVLERQAKKQSLSQLAEKLGIDTSVFYLSELGKCGCDYQETGFTLRYRVNWHCVECSRQKTRQWCKSEHYKKSKNKERYYKWLESPKLSPTVVELVEKEARRYFQQNRYQLDPEYRQRRLEYLRRRYKENPQKEKDRIKAYKAANPDRRDEHNKTRVERVKRQSDGSITADWVKKTINSAETCPYCLEKMEPEDKTLDHIIPIAKGGLHSRLNLVVCCGACNCRKADRVFPEWLDMLETKAREHALKLYTRRYGAAPEQGFLPFTFE